MDERPDIVGMEESGHTSNRKSARNGRVEIITRGERRRSWTPEQKREIVAESYGAGLTPTEIARKHAISSGQLYTWRRELLGVGAALVTRAAPRFAAVEMASAPQAAAPPPVEPDRPAVRPEVRSSGRIEIVLPGAVVVRVDATVDGAALRRVLDALERR